MRVSADFIKRLDYWQRAAPRSRRGCRSTSRVTPGHRSRSGVPLLVVAKNLGHADTRMVEKHYGHLAPSYVADAIGAGAPRFGGTPNPWPSACKQEAVHS
jgi:hypothetical protein